MAVDTESEIVFGKLTVLYKILVPTVALAFGAGGSWVVQVTKIGAVEKRLEKVEAGQEKEKDSSGKSSERLTRVETKLDAVQDMLEKIDRKLERER